MVPVELTPWIPLIAGVTVAVVGGVIGGVFLLLNRRGAERDRRTGQTPPTWPEIWARMDALEGEVAAIKRAVVNVLRDTSDQWPEGTPGPVFAAEDIAVLEDTMPAKWLKNRRRA